MNYPDYNDIIEKIQKHIRGEHAMNTQCDSRFADDFQNIRKQAKDMQEELVAIRRDIHAHPEQRFQEVRTAGVVSENLKKTGIEHRTGVGKTGVVGLLQGGLGKGKVIGIRCDMDAYPSSKRAIYPTAPRMKELCMPAAMMCTPPSGLVSQKCWPE